MNIEDLTIAQAREIAALVAGTVPAPAGSSFQTGKAYFIRTVTMNWTGRVVGQNGMFLHLHDAAWIADSGRYSDAIKNGSLSEIEPVDGTTIIGLGTIIDAVEWKHELPRKVK